MEAAAGVPPDASPIQTLVYTVVAGDGTEDTRTRTRRAATPVETLPLGELEATRFWLGLLVVSSIRM